MLYLWRSFVWIALILFDLLQEHLELVICDWWLVVGFEQGDQVDLRLTLDENTSRVFGSTCARIYQLAGESHQCCREMINIQKDEPHHQTMSYIALYLLLNLRL